MAIEVLILEIDWLDQETKEADVKFKINEVIYHAFCHPCNFKEGQIINVYFDYLQDDDIPFEILLNKNINKEKKLVARSSGEWEYEAYGQIVGLNPPILDCGGVSFELFKEFNHTQYLSKYFYLPIIRLDIYKQ